MIKRFKASPTAASRALQIWLILIGKAHNRQTMTYEQLAELLGYGGAGTMAQLLGHVYHFCSQNELPPLTALVVNKKTGLPGQGLPATDLHAQRELVFRYRWYEMFPPTLEQLAQAYQDQ